MDTAIARHFATIVECVYRSYIVVLSMLQQTIFAQQRASGTFSDSEAKRLGAYSFIFRRQELEYREAQHHPILAHYHGDLLCGPNICLLTIMEVRANVPN